MENNIEYKNKLPKDFLDEMKSILGDEYEDFLSSYEMPRTKAIRINTNKIDVDSFKKLNLFGIDFEKDRLPFDEVSFYVDESENPGKNPLHDAGAYYVQEPSAISVVGQTEINPGETILDMCAAPGGKSTYILSKLKNRGLLVSNEIDSKRVLALGENLERFGAINTLILNEKPETLLTFFKGYFDKVFIDAPCSGQGMFRKDEYAIEDWSMDKVFYCSDIQHRIIREGFEMLKPGGMLIYSTCTFSRKENEDVVEMFLAQERSASLVNMERLWPHRFRGEGHFCARIRKDISLEDGLENFDVTVKKKKGKKSRKTSTASKEAVLYFEKFAEDVFQEGFLEKLMEGRSYWLKDDNLYLVSHDIDKITDMKYLRKGLLLGQLRKNRFEPSHSLAMALCPDDVKNYADFKNDSEEIARYINGESLDTGKSRGWILVTVDRVSIGWGKESNSTLKNKYPKGLRRNIRSNQG